MLLTDLYLMLGGGVCHHRDLQLRHVLQLLVRLDPLLQTVDLLLEISVRSEDRDLEIKIEGKNVLIIKSFQKGGSE